MCIYAEVKHCDINYIHVHIQIFPLHRALSHPNKVEEKGHPLYGTAKEGDPEEGSEAAIAISKLTPLEQAAIRRIWELKRLVRVCDSTIFKMCTLFYFRV